MKEQLKQKYYWWAHLLWLIKNLLKFFLLLDEAGFVDTYFWIRIHLTCKSRRVK